MEYGKHGTLTNLRFADVVLLVGTSLYQAREMLKDLVTEARAVGFEIHPAKTCILNNRFGQGKGTRAVEMDGKEVKVLARTESTKYLGLLLNLCEPNDVEINFRIQRAWAKFAIYKSELTDKHYSLFQRLRLFNAVVTPTVLYGASSWAMTAAREQTLRTAQRKMIRSILGQGRKIIPKSSIDSSSTSAAEEDEEEEMDEGETLESWVQWKQRTTREALQIIDKIGIPDWADEQRRRLWRWAGHVARRTDGRWTKQVAYWVPSNNRTRGHPRRRWEDVLREFFLYQHNNQSWTRYAQDRELWNAAESDFVNYYYKQ